MKPNYIGSICTKFNKYEILIFFWCQSKIEGIVGGDKVMGNWMETWVGGKVGECWRDMEKGTRSAWLLLIPEAGHRRAHLNIMEFCYIQVPFLK